MYKLLFVLMCSLFFYYITKDLRVFAGVFIFLTALMFWGAQIETVNRRLAISQARDDIEGALRKRRTLLEKAYESIKDSAAFGESELSLIDRLLSGENNSEGEDTVFKEYYLLQKMVKDILAEKMEGSAEDRAETALQPEWFDMALKDVENELSTACIFYNDSAKEYNSAISTFPTSVMAKINGFGLINYFDADNGSC
ncbi:LemA family protein [Ruminiclostridium hungatei]|uniref:LemA family protein n=1 Tax=Ruminiclostridium hungatei TaxID=48256 RepID=A0A1V4SP52_RUMHU|nr:LemA family protein [Ruminiclostridium hungatei]OPX45245.1 LemA family protein [Ruminiclostridium hungatei]